MASLILLLACLHADGLEGCAAQGDPIAREECRYDALLQVVGDDAALDAALAAIPEPASRDLALYRLAVDEVKKGEAQRAQALCRRTVTPNIQEKCSKVIGRPHLAGPPRP